MMDRTHFHKQIAILAEKIAFLNERLSKEQTIHTVETELLRGYAGELHHIIDEFAKYNSLSSRLTEEQAVTPAACEMEKKITPEAKPDAAYITDEPVEKTSGKVILTDEITVTEVSKEKEVEEAGKKPVVEANPVDKVAATSRATAKEGKKISLNEKFRKEATPLAEKLKEIKKRNLKELFDINERYSFIEELFGGSAEQFRKAMNDLSKCTSLEEAEAYIKNTEMKYSWQDRNQALVLRFTRQVLEVLNPVNP